MTDGRNSNRDDNSTKTFALIGVGGFVAPRHLKAIHDTGNRLVAAADPYDSVGVLDRFFPEARFFTEIERFDRYLEKLRRESDAGGVDYLSICSPNFLHDAHVRLALRVRAHAICEKPLVINPWNLDALAELESEFGRRIFTVLQLRLHPVLVALKKQFDSTSDDRRADICLTYVTRRGRWYARSWKGDPEKSGGVVMNIGIHLFDALLWLFGRAERSQLHLARPDKAAGHLLLERASVRWFLSVDGDDLPENCRQQGASAFRSIQIDGQEIDFTSGFDNLHTRLYERTIAGQGFGIEDARPSIEMVHSLKKREVEQSGISANAHPALKSL